MAIDLVEYFGLVWPTSDFDGKDELVGLPFQF